METKTATVASKMPGSGSSCYGDRPGSARSCTDSPCRATDETPASTVARVKTRSGNARGEIADPADGQRSGWVENSEWMGSLREHVCETRRDLHGVFCSQSARCRLRTGGAHVLAWRTPRIARFVFFNARVTSWLPARVVGVRQEGVNPCRMVPSMWDEVHVQLHDVTGKVQRARLCLPCKDARGASCRAGDAHVNLKKN